MVGKTYLQQRPRLTAVLQALLVTFIWSMSWVLIKIGLEDIPPVTFAGLRYFLGFLFLLPLFLRSSEAKTLHKVKTRNWIYLIVLGIVYYTLNQGAIFVSLANLPAVTLNLMLGFSSPTVAILGILFLHEAIFGRQWLGIAITLAGAAIYFYPLLFPAGQWLGYAAAIVAFLSTAGASIIGRNMNRSGHLSSLTITVISMGIGSISLLIIGLATQGLPALHWQSWLIIGWLALVHTAFAFTLWNHTLRTLPAVESSIINNTMAVQIPILAVIFLGETITLKELIGLAVVIAGTLLVQLGKKRM
ncbi:MAG: DMT family transporter [Candidatus Promineifilaceae bacterium]